MLEYLNNIYILPLLSTIVGITIVYLYDKFEKKQYTSAIYLRIGLLIYISSFSTFYLSKYSFFLNNTNNQSGGSVIDPQSMMPQANVLNTHLEQFKTGVPTF